MIRPELTDGQEMIPEAHVIVSGFEPEIYVGEDALINANIMADIFRADFPNNIIGVIYNSAAAESASKIRMQRLLWSDYEEVD